MVPALVHEGRVYVHGLQLRLRLAGRELLHRGHLLVVRLEPVVPRHVSSPHADTEARNHAGLDLTHICWSRNGKNL